MSEEEITEDDFENFDEKTKEEKLETMEKLYRKAVEKDGKILDDLPVDVTVTAKVFDENGDLKQEESAKAA